MNNYIKENSGYITQSKLKCYMESPEAYKKIYIDEIDTSFVPESSALKNGTMIDEAVLTPDEFNKHFAILDGSLKADLERQCLEKSIPIPKGAKVPDLKALLVGNKTVLTDGDVKMVDSIKKELKRQPLFDYDGKYDCQKEIVVDYKGLKLKAKIDRRGTTLIRDLKTSKDVVFKNWTGNTALEEQLTNFDEYGYIIQLAFYTMLDNIQNGGEWKGAVIDAIRTSGNFAYESYYIHPEILQKKALQVIFPALDKLIEDTKNDHFVDKVDPETRGNLINNRYYPVLDSAIQKTYRHIYPSN